MQSDKTNFGLHLFRRWIEMNNRMKEIGVDAYYEETKDPPRYRQERIGWSPETRLRLFSM